MRLMKLFSAPAERLLVTGTHSTASAVCAISFLSRDKLYYTILSILAERLYVSVWDTPHNVQYLSFRERQKHTIVAWSRNYARVQCYRKYLHTTCIWYGAGLLYCEGGSPGGSGTSASPYCTVLCRILLARHKFGFQTTRVMSPS